MIEMLSQAHFLRPSWLLALVPALVLLWCLARRKADSGQWANVIDPALREHMLIGEQRVRSRLWLWALGSAWLLAIVALAGPTWERVPTPVSKNQDALVILLDQSLSMAAADLSPSRAERSKQKITDILRARKDGQTALVVYAGGAHTVTPLTDDHDTITHLLPSLSPFIMPQLGSRPDKAIALAQQLVTDAGVRRARILLLTDSITERDIDRIKSALKPSRFSLGVIAVGTKEGAPVSLPSKGFLRDNNGQIVLPTLNTTTFEQLQARLNVPWSPLAIDDTDWQRVLSTQPTINDGKLSDLGKRKFDAWFDLGFWLIFPLLPVALVLFRRGVLMNLATWLPATVLALSLCAVSPPNAWAQTPAQNTDHSPVEFSWLDRAFSTPDQRGMALFDNAPAQAAKQFEHPNWRAASHYKAKQFQQAAKQFEQDSSATGHFNRGNALAHQGQYEQAMQAFDQALKQQPDFAAAKHNKAIAEKLKQLKKKQQQQQNNADQNSSNDKRSNSNQNKHQDNHSDNKTPDNTQGESQQSKDDSSNDNQPSSDQKNNRKDGKQQNKKQAAKQNKPQGERQADKPSSEQGNKPSDKASKGTATTGDELSREEEAAMKQWLQRVPDNPGTLLQRKFLYQYRQQENKQTEDVLW